MSSRGTNDLRMPFAEWLFRMAEANVPYQARSLAVYAVLFKVSANDELAKLSGMDTKGLADKTYNKWKRLLSDEGWVILKSVTIGRATTIEVSPSFKTKPVTFTDVAARDPARFAQNKSYGREEQVTSESYGRNVEVTDETEKVTAGKVTVTAEEKTSPAPAHAEVNNNIYNNYNNLPTKTAQQTAVQGSVREELENLYSTLRGACNGALAPEVNSLGLIDVSVPRMWLSEGADLELDILPTLRGIGAKRHGENISTWKYFTKAVAEAKAYREAGLPQVNVSRAAKKESNSEKLSRRFKAAETEKEGG